MKRSRTIRLALLGSASALALVACDEAKDPLADANFFRDPVECARNLDRAACERAFVEARDEHLRSAPAFGTRAACEQANGAANCAWQETNVSPDQVQEPRPGATPSGGGGSRAAAAQRASVRTSVSTSARTSVRPRRTR